MTSFCAIIPVANMAAANATLEGTAQNPTGFGPNNFSVPSYAGPNPSFASLHSWNDAVFENAVKAIPGVQWEQSEGDPAVRTTALMASFGAQWSADAPPLVGQVTPGLYTHDGKLWWVVQAYNADVYDDPYIIPALVVQARVPGEVTVWVQPLNQYDAYYLHNPFTGLPDQVTHNGKQWYVSQGDGAGLNIWEPGVFGWLQV